MAYINYAIMMVQNILLHA